MDSANSLEDVIKKISEKSGTSADEIKKLIEEKQDELSGLVSKEGAMHIVARELGVSLLKKRERELKVCNLVPGLRAVDMTARIVRIMEPRQFEKNGKQGQVMNIILGDETGTVRMSMWNDEVGLIKKLCLNEGDCIKLTGGYVKVDNMDNPELRIGKGILEKSDAKIEAQKPLQDTRPGSPDTGAMPAKRHAISEFREGAFEEARAALVQLFRRNPFYNVCPTCDARVTQKDSEWYCEEHGKVKPKPQLVLSGVIDDGTDNIRVVFFREMAEKVFGKSTDELAKIAEASNDPFAIYEHFRNLGREFIIRGRVKKNAFTDSLELVANDVSDVDVKKEAEYLIKEL